MDKPKHTPGPWKYDNDGTFIIVPNGHVQIECIHHGKHGHEQMSEAEYDANYRLFAAAPELLECLETISETMPTKWTDNDGLILSFSEEFITQMNDLIKKARGEK